MRDGAQKVRRCKKIEVERRRWGASRVSAGAHTTLGPAGDSEMSWVEVYRLEEYLCAGRRRGGARDKGLRPLADVNGDGLLRLRGRYVVRRRLQCRP